MPKRWHPDVYADRQDRRERESEGMRSDLAECPHGWLIVDEDCPNCASERERVDEDDERGPRGER